MRIRASQRAVRTLVVLWTVAVLGGLALVWRYKSTPGAPADPPMTWPADSVIEQTPGHPTLVMLAHPRCSCTRASLSELAAVMSRFHGRLDATVLFLRPAGSAPGWERSDTWERASSIPGVTVKIDEDGEEAARFGASVSGQTVFYDGQGVLRFRGGITGARGHEGDNEGLRRLTAAIEAGAGVADERRESPVFGCSLRDDEALTGEGG